MFIKNAYPKKLIYDTINKFTSKMVNNNNTDLITKNAETYKILPLQFRGFHSQLFSKKIKKIIPDLHVVFTTTKSRHIFKLPTHYLIPINSNKSKVIYKYTCPTCSKHYIGRTKRHLYSRINEHFQKELFYKHHVICNPTNNNINTFSNNFKILDIASTHRELYILEALYILTHKPHINRQLSVDCGHTLKLRNF